MSVSSLKMRTVEQVMMQRGVCKTSGSWDTNVVCV